MKEYKFVAVLSEESEHLSTARQRAKNNVAIFEQRLNELAGKGWSVINSDLEELFALMEREKNSKNHLYD